MQYQDLSKEQLIEICQHFDKSLETIAAGLNSAIVNKFGEEYDWEPEGKMPPLPKWDNVVMMREEANSCLHYVHDSMMRQEETEEDEIESIEIRNWTDNELTIEVCRDYYPFPATQPKFHLGQLVRHIDFTRSGVIIAIGSECPALEWIYIVLFSNAERLDVRECYESDLASVKPTNN